MKRENETTVSEFLLQGLPIPPEQQGLFFTLFLVMYLATVVGNLLIILLIRMDTRLHTPMYFFLSALALTDVSFSSVTVPKMLVDMQSNHKSIPYAGCVSQMYFFIWFGCLDNFLLAVMAYDRYVAICQPLHYTTIMRQERCVSLVTISWLLCCFHSLLHTLLLKEKMRRDNQSCASEFLLLGLPIRPEKQGLYYALFLAMYLTTVLGNLLIILLIRLDSRLHTPMYFFLSHLAFSDISFTSVTAPKMLFNMQTRSQFISYASCVSQVYFFLIFGSLDSLLLTSMAYDRYVAICHPLHYITIMSQSLCSMLVIVSWVLSYAGALLHTLLLARLSFCGDKVVPHFFCDLSVLLKMSSSDTTVNDLVIFTEGVASITLPFICILVSYGRIGTTILRVPSTKGIFKALSTCGSHLTVVSLYYGSIIALYFFPSSTSSNDENVIVSVLYALVTPMLNPFIYSLRNRDIKGALGNILSRGILLSR
ncbi:olfactory receptor 50-like [Sorex araneus]|uniref:olfactory receptor 50-like n=1 Tax=Sorex araneus TaxID=42254 RepID=UPI002433633C|nr:olfactory receptor 50-like [Sorex araneus]